MSNVEKYELERIYEKEPEFHGRDEKGLIKDKIYRGIFESTLMKIHGFQKHELKHFEKQGWIKRTYINPDGKGLRNAYLWTAEEMPQRGWKSFFDRIYRYCTGDYDRYYGRD